MTIDETILKTLSEDKEYIRGDEFVNLIARKTKESKDFIKEIR